MKKLIILCVVLVCNSFITFPTVAMQSKRNRVTDGFVCEGCKVEFTQAKSRVKHILTLHYACPWCNDLECLDKDALQSISAEDKKIRVEHIKKCAQKRRTSLWQCEKCFVLSHYINKDHKCGLSYQISLIGNELLNAQFDCGIRNKEICYQCPEPKKLENAGYYNNHMICKHAMCPWCDFKFANEVGPFRRLKLQEREVAVNHLIGCSLVDNKSLFFCYTCFGVKVADRAVHLNPSCKGILCGQSKKINKAQEAEPSILDTESVLLNSILNEENQSVLSGLQEEHDNSVKDESYLVSDFLKDADLEINGSTKDTYLFTENWQTDLVIVHEDERQENLLADKISCNGVICEKSNYFQQQTTCNKCPKKKRHRSVLAFKNHMLREHGMCLCGLFQFTNDNNPFQGLSLKERQASLNHLIQCSQLKNEKLFVCNTCFGVKLGNKNGTHFKSSKKPCKGLISEQIYTAQEAELLVLDSESVSLDQILEKQPQKLLNACEEYISVFSENSPTYFVTNIQDKISLQDFFQIISNNSVEPEGDRVADTNCMLDFTLDSTVCSSLYSQTGTQSCDVSRN